jgi:hypothetical protein
MVHRDAFVWAVGVALEAQAVVMLSLVQGVARPVRVVFRCLRAILPWPVAGMFALQAALHLLFTVMLVRVSLRDHLKAPAVALWHSLVGILV